MDCQVWLRQEPDLGYVATVLGWPTCEGVGPTEQDALRGARRALARALTHGKVVTMQVEVSPRVDSPGNPWVEDAGIWQNDPQWEEFQAAVAEYRREIEAQETESG